MIFLLIASLIWGFSFGIIGNTLWGLSAPAVAFTRLLISLLMFVPFAGGRRPTSWAALALMFIGAVQFGLMYLLYIASFRYLESHTVALFTVFTPIHVALLSALSKPKSYYRPLIAASLATAGAAVINWRTSHGSEVWLGFLLVQGSNLSFATGQMLYRRLAASLGDIPNRQATLWMYAGAAALTLPFGFIDHRSGLFKPTTTQLWALLYLGVVASGIGFWLWNLGVRKIRRTASLAVMNNAKIPLGVAVSLVFFGEKTDYRRLAAATVLMLAAIAVCEWRAPRQGGTASAELVD